MTEPTFTKEQLERLLSIYNRTVEDEREEAPPWAYDARDLAAFALSLWEERDTLRAIALTAEHLCKHDGSKAMTAKGHFYDAAKAYEYSERLHELLAEWRKGQKEGRW